MGPCQSAADRRFGRRSPSSRCSSPRSGSAASASATEFPAGKTGYHSYTEMAADVAAVAAAHPDIVQRFSIGKSYQGRDIWAVKISDNVGVDEPEPEVLFDGATHSDEHMGVEMTLHILHWLVDGYGTDAADHEHREHAARSGSSSRSTPTAPSTTSRAASSTSGARTASRRRARPSIGTDLNRNYGYHWGGGGRTSSNPPAITYRGPERLLGARRRAPCATSSPAGSSTAGSRSGPRSRSTRTAGW